jgi:hypothetical protein
MHWGVHRGALREGGAEEEGQEEEQEEGQEEGQEGRAIEAIEAVEAVEAIEAVEAVEDRAIDVEDSVVGRLPRVDSGSVYRESSVHRESSVAEGNRLHRRSRGQMSMQSMKSMKSMQSRGSVSIGSVDHCMDLHTIRCKKTPNGTSNRTINRTIKLEFSERSMDQRINQRIDLGSTSTIARRPHTVGGEMGRRAGRGGNQCYSSMVMPSMVMPSMVRSPRPLLLGSPGVTKGTTPGVTKGAPKGITRRSNALLPGIRSNVHSIHCIHPPRAMTDQAIVPRAMYDGYAMMDIRRDGNQSVRAGRHSGLLPLGLYDCSNDYRSTIDRL